MGLGDEIEGLRGNRAAFFFVVRELLTIPGGTGWRKEVFWHVIGMAQRDDGIVSRIEDPSNATKMET